MVNPDLICLKVSGKSCRYNIENKSNVGKGFMLFDMGSHKPNSYKEMRIDEETVNAVKKLEATP